MLIATCLAKTNTLVHRHKLFECFLFFFCLLSVYLKTMSSYLSAFLVTVTTFIIIIIITIFNIRLLFKYSEATWKVAPETTLHKNSGSYKVLCKYFIPNTYSKSYIWQISISMQYSFIATDATHLLQHES